MDIKKVFSLAHSAEENAVVNDVLQRWQKALDGSPTSTALPPGISKEQWPSILDEFRSAVGSDGVIVGEEHRDHYGDPFVFVPEEKVLGSSAAVLPASVEQVQAVMRVANKYKIPLWTISRGKNLGYGGPTPRVKGSVIVDLQRMNKIIEVNDKYFYYTVEPGVSFYQLYEYIRDNKKQIWPSIPALGWGSIVGNALERGWGYTPSGDHSNHTCGMEVVLADGTVVRTGMGAIADSPCWNLFRGGFGPMHDSLFTQSNFGIVTKMGLWATPKPEGYMSCHLDVEEETDLAPMVDIFTQLMLRHVIQNHPVIGNIPRALSMLGPRSKFYDGPGAIPDARLLELKKELGIGFWDARFALYGPREVIEANYRKCQKAFEKIPGSKLIGTAFYPKDGNEFLDAEDIPKEHAALQVGIPQMWPILSLQYRAEDGAHIGFSPVLPPDGKAALDFYYTAKATSADHGFDFYAGLHLYPRHLIHINMLFFDRQSEEQKKNVNRLFHALVKDARDAGYSEYRAHVAHMEKVAAQYDFNNHALSKLNVKLKDALDPNGILSPGKQGIWPGNTEEKNISERSDRPKL